MSDGDHDRRKRRRIPPFAIVSSTIWTNAKICRAGADGALFYIFALTKNAERGRTGSFPASDVDPWYVARQLGIDEQRASQALAACVAARLLEIDGATARLVGWDDEWSRASTTDSERRQRDRERAAQRSESEGEVDPDLDLEIRHKNKSSPGDTRTEPDNVRTILSRSGLREFTPEQARKLAAYMVLKEIGEWTGVHYSGLDEHYELVGARMDEGYTQEQLISVVGYCASELGWHGDAEKERWLRPETLFGPSIEDRSSFAKYIDQALTWANRGIEIPAMGAE